jgi:hypothetical protein
MLKKWAQRSIEELEGLSYGKPEPSDTNLIARCKTFAKIPVGKLSVEQLRTLISQRIALPYLILLALEILKVNILAEGDFYPGDLLESLNKVKVDFGKKDSGLLAEFEVLLKANAKVIDEEGLDLR